MRISVKSAVAVFLFVALFGCREQQEVEIETPAEDRAKTERTADIADVEFSDGLIGKLWHNYLQVGMALSEADANQVQSLGDSMLETFDAEMVVLRALALQMSESDDIEVQRRTFAKFTDEVGPLFENALSAGTIYKKRCPANNEGDADFWYSDIKESPNPYSEEEVSECQSIVEVFSKEHK